MRFSPGTSELHRMGLQVLVVVLVLLLPGGSSAPVESASQDEAQQLEALKAKLQSLQSALNEVDGNIATYVEAENKKQAVVADKRNYLAAPQVSAHDQDQALKEFAQGLSKEDQALLKNNQHKVKYLQAELSHPSQRSNPGDGVQEEKRVFLPEANVPPKDQDKAYQDFKNQLSADDLELLKKMGSKANLLQAAVHDQVRKEAVSTDVSQRSLEARKMDKFLKSLSPEDQALVQNSKSKLRMLMAAMQPEEGANNGDEDVAPIEDTKRQITTEEKELLKSVKDKLESLKRELQHFNEKREMPQNDEVDEHISLGTFGEFVDDPSSKRELSPPTWKDEAFSDSQLEGKPLPEAIRECRECGCAECRCVEGRCHTPPKVDADAVAKRVLADLEVAKASGVEMKNLLRALATYKHKGH